MQFFWKHLHNNKGDENVSKLIWIVIAFVIGALLLSTMSVAFRTEGAIGGWLSSSLEEWFGEADGRDGSVSGGTGGSGGGLPGGNLPGGNPDEGGGNEEDEIIPEGAVYYVGVTETELNPDGYADSCDKVLTAGSEFPETVSVGDVYVFEDYEYRYNMIWDGEWFDVTEMLGDEEVFIYYGICEGWYVQILNREQESYSDMLSVINNEPVTVAFATFVDCPNLKEPPVLSQNLISMSHTFFYNSSNVSKLTIAPVIPDTVQVMTMTFGNCTSLTTAPVLPDSLMFALATFSGCDVLKTYAGSSDEDGDFSNYIIPSTVKDMSSMFSGCKKITKAPVLPAGVLSLDSTFDACSSLSEAPVIPDSVIDMQNTFHACTSLTQAPVIPDSVINMNYTFFNCYSLTTAPAIPKNVLYLDNTFYECSSLTGIVQIFNENISSSNAIFFGTQNPIVVKVKNNSNSYTLITKACINQSNITIEAF